MRQNKRPTILRDYPHLLHGGDYNPDQWRHDPGVIDEDFRLMKLAGCNAFSVGIFAWTALEPADGRYTFGWLDDIMDRAARAGSRIILATPSGAKPAWLSRAHPEIRRVGRDGLRAPHTGRHNHCWQSPVYRRKVREMNTRLARRYGRHPALGMWHLSNEYSGECFCEHCLAAWRRWLRARHGTLDRLNLAWWAAFWSHTFTAWEEIDPRDGSMDGMQLDWIRFCNWQIADFYRWEAAPLKRHAPGVPCTTNFMGFHGRIDYGRLADEVDVVADDQYPAYDPANPDLVRLAHRVGLKHDLYRGFKPGRPWMLMESCPGTPQYRKPMRVKRAELHRAEMLQAVGHGAEGTCYFQWRAGRGGQEKFHGAVVDHMGNEHTRVFQSVAAVGRLYRRLVPVLGSAPKAEVGLLYDWEARWGLELSGGPDSDDDGYARVAVDHYQPLRELGVAVDVFHSERDFSGYKLLVAPQLWMLKPGVARRLRAFVEGGGTLVATYYTGVCDETNRCFTGGWPGDGLGEVFGLWDEETDVQPPAAVRRVRVAAGAPFAAGRVLRARRVCALVHLRGARALATYAEDFYRGRPALTVNRFGKGRAFYHAAQLEPDGLRAFYGWLARDLGLARDLPAPPPRGVLVQRRAKPGAQFLFLQNFTPKPQRARLGAGSWRDMDTGAAVRNALVLAPFGSAVLQGG